MIKKINKTMVCGYLKIKSFFTDLQKDERAMEIVQVVLLVLVGVLLILALWAVMSGWLANLWERITGTSTTNPGNGFNPEQY